ncbi:MAG TPA: YXWGXW repeat-containing protein [Casimicrobiaceae bacterium]|nr:YXWGXW repeat-containing protein [Casimicrobiaceae bacterium]
MNALTALRRGSFAVVLAAMLLGASSSSSAFVAVSVAIAPPAIPVYEQPLIPGPGYIWVPGYWAWGFDGYYWVPGTWVLAPYVGALWTPGYWGWDGGYYAWYPGYWGPRVGFYGGINYGFGYFGVGYHGGYWRNGVFNYNTAVNNINVTYIRNVYNAPAAANTNTSRVSFNGGTGGIVATPTAAERLAAHDRHQSWTQAQVRHERAASTDRAQLASVNRGVPSVTATSRPGAFREQNAAAVRGGGGGNREARIERAGPQGQSAVNAGPPRGNREARIERGGPPPSAGGGPPQNMARPQNVAQPQGQTQPQGQPRGGRGGEHQEKEKEKQK